MRALEAFDLGRSKRDDGLVETCSVLAPEHLLVPNSFLLLVRHLLLVAMPGAPSSFLFLVVRPGAPSSVLAPNRDGLCY